ncbi:MAG: hypothetical protein WHS46_07040 [Desulfosoma sp.]
MVNFQNGTIQFGDNASPFDLDGHGLVESLPFVSKGKDFLALNKNDDGPTNEGLELFGPKTGNDFSELAFSDVDGNGWIDEAYAVFRRLRQWVRIYLAKMPFWSYLT